MNYPYSIQLLMKKFISSTLERFGNRHQDGTVAQTFRAVLGRKPNPKELVELEGQLALHGRLESVARDLLLSREFSIQILPQLVAKWTTSYNGKRVFFLHVPKTAGTSVRLALMEALGVPSINFYPQHSIPHQGLFFWPYLAGHVGVAAIPDTHQGFTVFRESRTRMLSRYRQRQRHLAVSERIPLDNENPHRISPSLPEPWQLWRNDRLDRWFHMDVAGRVDQSNWATRNSVLDSMSQTELTDGVYAGLRRITHAAWAHDADTIARTLCDVTGVEQVEIPQANVYSPHVAGSEPVQLTTRDLDTLEQSAQRDQISIDAAVDLGLIPPMSSDVAESIFQSTVRRLNFVLP